MSSQSRRCCGEAYHNSAVVTLCRRIHSARLSSNCTSTAGKLGGDKVAGEFSISRLPAGTYRLTVQALANLFRGFENYRTPQASRTNPGYSSLREIIGEVSSEASDLRPGPPDV
jgi:hypothetical protein